MLAIRRNLLFAAVFVGTLSIGTTMIIYAQQPANSGTPTLTRIAPPERYYPLMFRHILMLQTQSQNLQPGLAEDTPGIKMQDFFGDTVGMTNTENTMLLREALSWQRDVAPVDAAAHNMIDKIHAQTPGGKLAPGQAPPTPPAELVTMQAHRDGLTLAHVKHMQTVMGDARFTQFDTRMRYLTQGHSTFLPTKY